MRQSHSSPGPVLSSTDALALIPTDVPPADPAAFPVITVADGHDKRWRKGHPWLFSNELVMDAAAKALAPGGLVRVQDSKGGDLGVASFNPHPLIAARRLTRSADARIDQDLITSRLTQALDTRQRLYRAPFYRLIHGEADGLPATIIDRYGDVLVIECNSAGAEALLPLLLPALIATLAPRSILVRNDSAVRALEQRPSYTAVAHGEIIGPVMIEENSCRFPIDLLGGQKTGWFYDQRDNRAFVAALCQGRHVFDGYCYRGGFGIACAVAGAASVTCVDRSKAALAAVEEAATLNKVGDQVSAITGDVFDVLATERDRAQAYEVVIVDPPAFIKNRKDIGAGLRAYRKLCRLAARVVAPGGVLLIASCSHHAAPEKFAEAVRGGLTDAGRTGAMLRWAGAAPDHPTHPFLPESGYLKAQVLRLD